MTLRLGLCWATVAGASLVEHIDAAASAGYAAISISAEQYAESGQSDSDIRRRLEDNGLIVDIVDPALTWLPGIEPMAGSGLLAYDVGYLFDAAAALGAKRVNAAAALPGPWSEAEITEAFAALCRRGAEAGIGVLLEFMSWGVVGDLATAARVVRSSGAANAAVMFDVWHFHRGGGEIADLFDADLDLVAGIQLNDAAPTAEGDLMAESMSARLLPGDGAIALVDLMPRLLRSPHVDVVSIEIFSADLARRPHAEAAMLSAQAAHRVLEEIK